MPRIHCVKFFLVALMWPVTSRAQKTEVHPYVASVAGDWIMVGDTARLHEMDPVLPTALVRLRSTASADTTDSLVLRYPKIPPATVTLTCKPIRKCLEPQAVSAQKPSDAPRAISSRTAPLFVQIGGPEERSRVTIVGGRGTEPDWGLVVLKADSGLIDVTPLESRLDVGGVEMAARLCPLRSNPRQTYTNCVDPSDASSKECTLVRGRSCEHGAQLYGVPVGIRIYVRQDSTMSSNPVARAFGVVSGRRSFRCVTRLMDQYRRDLAALQSEVGAEDFRALEAVAAAAVMRACN